MVLRGRVGVEGEGGGEGLTLSKHVLCTCVLEGDRDEKCVCVCVCVCVFACDLDSSDACDCLSLSAILWRVRLLCSIVVCCVRHRHALITSLSAEWSLVPMSVLLCEACCQIHFEQIHVNYFVLSASRPV